MRTSWIPWLFLATALVMSAAAADDEPRVVSVSGAASVSAAPDRARIVMGVEARDPVLQTARKQVSSVAGKFLKICKSLGIPESKVQSSGVTMRPEYRWLPEQREQQLLGYYVQRQLVVELDDLELIGKVIEAAVDAGVNQVSPPALDSSRREALHREALAAAANDARANATALATTLGVRLGTVRRIDAGDAGRPPQPMMARAMAMEADSAADSYQTGDIRVDARVNAEFELLAD